MAFVNLELVVAVVVDIEFVVDNFVVVGIQMVLHCNQTVVVDVAAAVAVVGKNHVAVAAVVDNVVAVVQNPFVEHHVDIVGCCCCYCYYQ